MAQKVARNYRFVKPCNVIPAVHTIMSLNGHTPYLRWKYPNITKDGYFWAYPYNESKINETLKDLGWRTASDNKSPWRFDCEIDSLKNYLFKRLVGATEKDDLFSKNIRAGSISREEALSRLEEGDVNTEIVERVLNKVGMKLSELDIVERRVS